MRYEKGTFTTVPNKRALKGEDAYIECVFFWICGYADDDGICFPSIPTLAKDAGCSETSVHRAIRRLEEIGILRKTNRKEGNKNLSNVYQICLVVSDRHQGGVSQAPGGGASGTGELNPSSLTKPTEEAPRPAAPKRAALYREDHHSDDLEDVIDAETGQKVHNRAFDTLPTLEIVRWAEARMGRKFPTFRKQMGCIAKMFDAGYTSDAIHACWERLEKDEFWSGRGFDFGIVLNEIGKSRPNAGGRTGMKFENGMLTRYRDGKIISQEKLK